MWGSIKHGYAKTARRDHGISMVLNFHSMWGGGVSEKALQSCKNERNIKNTGPGVIALEPDCLVWTLSFRMR